MYSQLGQDHWVLEKLNLKRNGFYVDIGASNGITNSNSYLLQQEYQWSGILAEPRQSAYSGLISRQSLYDGKCIVFYGAVVGNRHECSQVEFNEYQMPELSTVRGYEGGDKLAGARTQPHTYLVPCATLDQVLKECYAPHEIDYLSLDTEGSEYDILSALDFRQWDIKLITVEHNETSSKGKINKLSLIHPLLGRFCNQSWII